VPHQICFGQLSARLTLGGGDQSGEALKVVKSD
jgi:hypothetical protein